MSDEQFDRLQPLVPAPGATPDRDLSADLISILVHDIRNLVAPIRNAAHIVRLRAGADRNAAGLADIMDRQVNGVGQLLERMIEADDIRRGALQLNPVQVDAAELLSLAAAGAGGVLTSRGQRLHTEFRADGLKISADRRLEKILGGLLEHAALRTPSGGELNMTLKSAGQTFEVCIRGGDDIRPGPAAFSFFSQSRPASDRPSFADVQWAVAAEIVKRHGGRLDIHESSTILITLPACAQESVVSSTAASMPSDAITGNRVLIIDDNPALTESLREILVEMSYDAKIAGNGHAGLNIAREWKPQFALIDINMPGLNGFEVAKALRSEFPAGTMKLIMMSGDTVNEAMLRAARHAGADDCVDKIQDIAVIVKKLKA